MAQASTRRFRASARGIALAILAGFCFGCNGSGSGAASAADARALRDTSVVHEECALDSGGAERLDANADGRADVTIVRENGRELCRAVDLNFDGVIDTWSYRDGAGQLRRRENDFDRDGKVDEITVLRAGVVVEKHRATTIPGQLDTWEFYSNGALARTERDSDGDERVDQWWEYSGAGCPMMHSDTNRDGKPDPGTTIDYCKETGYVPPERQDYRQAESPDFQRREALPEETEVKEVDTDKPEGGAKP